MTFPAKTPAPFLHSLSPSLVSDAVGLLTCSTESTPAHSISYTQLFGPPPPVHSVGRLTSSTWTFLLVAIDPSIAATATRLDIDQHKLLSSFAGRSTDPADFGRRSAHGARRQRRCPDHQQRLLANQHAGRQQRRRLPRHAQYFLRFRR